MYWTFKDISQFERFVRNHLTQYLKHKGSDGHNVKNTKSQIISEKQIIRDYCLRLKQRFSTIDLFGERESGSDDSQIVIDRMRNIDSGFVPLHLKDWLDESDRRETSPLEISDLFLAQP